MSLHCKTPPLRVEMVDRLSPIDQNLRPPQKVKQNRRKSHKTPPLCVVGEPLVTMALHCKTPPLRVEMVDRLSPIDRNLKPPQRATKQPKKP